MSRIPMLSTKTGAARLLIGAVIGLVLLKIAVGWLTGSVSVLAQAADSALDLFGAAVTYSAVRVASRPADGEHPYGHGKVEDIAGVVQGILIFAGGVLIVYASIHRIVVGATVELAEAGIGAMLVSIVASILLSRHLLEVSRATGSVALEANARNIAADVYSALAVLVGLAIVRFTGLGIVDSVIAIGVAGYVLVVAHRTVRSSLSGLIDTRLPPSQERLVEDALAKHRQQVVSYHALRTRRAGSQHHIDLHLVMPKDMGLQEAHEVCDRIEAEIQAGLPQSSVTIHVEPCSDECDRCSVACSMRQPS